MEDDDVVQAVQKLRLEETLDLVQHQVPRLLIAGGGGLDEADGALVRGQGLGAQVGGTDEDGVAERNLPPLAVGESPVLQDLQQHVEDVGVGLLHLVEQYHRVGVAPHPLGELTALAIADVAGRGADHLRDLVALHVLGHV